MSFLHKKELIAQSNFMDIKQRKLNILLRVLLLAFLLLPPIFGGFLTKNQSFLLADNKIMPVADNKLQGFDEVMASFSTSYATSGENRKHNIRRALQSLNGVIVERGEVLSFNKVVGKRTQECGYRQALIIQNGSYVKGYGGGVCQVSTTLYNAWLLAGLDVKYVQAHTLPSSYVDLSRDATVSSEIDLTLVNTSEGAVKLLTKFDDKTITISVCGKKKEYEYKLISQKLAIIHPEEQVVEVEGEGQGEEYHAGKDGYVSRLIIHITKGDRVVAKREIRRDYYAPQNAVRVVKK